MRRLCNENATICNRGVPWEEGCGPGWPLPAEDKVRGLAQPRKGRVSQLGGEVGGGMTGEGVAGFLPSQERRVGGYRNWRRKRTSLARKWRTSLMPYLSMAMRSGPMPKAKPL